MEKTTLLKASKADKLRFYRKEFFENAQSMKRGLFFIIFGIYTLETIHNLFITPSELYERTTTTMILTPLSYAITCACFYSSLFKHFKGSSDRILYLRYWIALLGTISLSFGLAYNTFFVFKQNLSINRPDEWLYALITERSEVWVVIIIDLVIPIWYMKLMVPTTYWIVQLYYYHQYDFEYNGMIWERCILFTLYAAALWGLKAYLHWKSFLDHLNTDAWLEIQKCILDKVPDAIAVVDADCKTYYSNTSFKNMCNDNLEDLSQRLSEIKKASIEQKPKIFMNFAGSVTGKGSDNSESTTRSRTNENIGTEFPEISLSLTKLLKNILSAVDKKELTPTDLFHFNSKCKSRDPEIEKLSSYEIKIIPLIEYKKIILMLDDTTQRDLAISLEAINQYKDKLLATVSHDLRAPINGSLTFIEHSIDHKAVPSVIKDQFLIPAHRSCKFLLNLVNDILDFSQINAQKLRMTFENFSILDTIKNCYQLLEVQAKQKNLIYSLDIDSKLSSEFNTDHTRVSQILINLLTNAIKFTSKGLVSLRASLIDDSLIEIKVTDTGIGMNEENQKKLFQDFTRIEHSEPQINSRGVGLGLVIANQLAKRLGPNDSRAGIKVVSTYGKGSTFSFLLEEKDLDLSKPKAISSRRTHRRDTRSRVSFVVLPDEEISLNDIDDLNTPRTKTSCQRPYINICNDNNTSLNSTGLISKLNSGRHHSQDQDSIRVLVVDDDPLNVLALTSLLKHQNISVDCAFNGEEAIEKVANIGSPLKLSHMDSSREPWNQEKKPGDYKLVFMDCEMPIMDGRQATNMLTKMMKNGELKTIPIIGCTGHKEEEKLKICYQSGMSEVLTKPISKEKIKNCLNKYLNIDSHLSKNSSSNLS